MICELLRSLHLLELDYFCGAGYGQNSQSIIIFFYFYSFGQLEN